MEWKMEFQTLNPEKIFVDFKKWKVKLERSNWNWKEWSWKDRAFRSVNQKLLNFRFSNLILSNSTIFPTKLSNSKIHGPKPVGPGPDWARTINNLKLRTGPGSRKISKPGTGLDQQNFENLGPISGGPRIPVRTHVREALFPVWK